MNATTESLKSEGTLVISCDPLPAENIILQILGVGTLPDSINNYNIKGYPWNFETKYYSAETYLYVLEQETDFDPEFSDSIRAVVFYFDSSKPLSFTDVVSWLPSLKSIDADVQLLICNNSMSESNDLERESILNWCVQNHYELVELNSNSDDEEEDESGIKDFKGYERVIQALQSHSWANLKMKEEKSEQRISEKKEIIGNLKNDSERSSENAACNSLVDVENCSKDNASKSDDKVETKKVNIGNEELELEEQLLSNVLNGEDPGGESFEALFQKFASMKDKASGLTGEERKKYAEEVAIAFWRAVGGDEDEINGLDDD